MSALLKLIATVAIVTAIASPSIAHACGLATHCPEPIPFVRPVLGWNPAPIYSGGTIMVGASNRPDYESHSLMVIRSNYGTTVINSVYRLYLR